MNIPEHYSKFPFNTMELNLKVIHGLKDELAFYVGNLSKYILRFKYKDGAKDLIKALDFLNRILAVKNYKGKIAKQIDIQVVDLLENYISKIEDKDIYKLYTIFTRFLFNPGSESANYLIEDINKILKETYNVDKD